MYCEHVSYAPDEAGRFGRSLRLIDFCVVLYVVIHRLVARLQPLPHRDLQRQSTSRSHTTRRHSAPPAPLTTRRLTRRAPPPLLLPRSSWLMN